MDLLTSSLILSWLILVVTLAIAYYGMKIHLLSACVFATIMSLIFLTVVFPMYNITSISPSWWIAIYILYYVVALLFIFVYALWYATYDRYDICVCA